MSTLTLIFAVAAGVGLGASWGYRTALYVALGRDGRLGGGPKPPKDNRALAPVPISDAQRERSEYAR